MTPEEIVAFSEIARAHRRVGRRTQGARVAPRAGRRRRRVARRRAVAPSRDGRIGTAFRPARAASSKPARPGARSALLPVSVELGWLSLFGADCRARRGILLRLTAAAIGVELARDGAAYRANARRGFWEALLARTFHDAAPPPRRSRRPRHRAGFFISSPWHSKLRVATRRAVRTISGSCASSQGRSLSIGGRRVGMLQRGARAFVFVPAPRAVDASNAKTAASLLPKSRRAAQNQVRASPAASAPSRRRLESARKRARPPSGACDRPADLWKRPRRRLRRAWSVSAALRRRGRRAAAHLRRRSARAAARLRRATSDRARTNAQALLRRRSERQDRGGRSSTFTVIPSSIGCGRSARYARASLDTPHDQLTLRLAVAIDELHDSN